MTTSTALVTYLGAMLHATRAALTPNIATGTVGLAWETDTQSLWAYDLVNAAWNKVGGGGNAGTPPTIVQSAVAYSASSAGITLGSAPTNGNLLVAMFFNPGSASVGSGWTSITSNSSGTDFGVIATKVAGASESATQSPIATAQNGIIAMWEIHGANASPILFAATQAEQFGLFAQAPSTPNITNALTLGCISLVSASNNIGALKNMTQDGIVGSGTTRQAVMGHSDAGTPIGQPVSVFSGTGAPGNKSAVITLTT